MAARPSVLVLEPDPDLGAMAGDVLRGEGYLVVPAADLARAEALLVGLRFDVVLADPLRGATGGLGAPSDRWAALERIRDLAAPAPVVIFTSHDPALFAGYRERGFAALVPKPFDLDALLAALRQTIERWAP